MNAEGLSAVPDEFELGPTIRGLVEGQQLFGRYVLRQVLGRGGMGVVWLAHDEKLERDVALKFLPEMVKLDAGALDDLKRETRRSLELTHPHIVRIHDFVEDNMLAGISMEYINGPTLSGWRVQKESRVFETAELAPWIEQACEALDYAHRRAKVIHRDLKPANLMVTMEGELKVADFGIARSVSDSVSRVSMRAGGSSGTLAYMSPQQAQGRDAKATDDIYSLGATIYELLTSKPPFYSGNIQHQIESIDAPSMTDRRESLGIIGQEIPVEWEEAVAACLAKEAADRPQSAAELAHRLGLRSQHVPAPVVTKTRPIPKIETQVIVKPSPELSEVLSNAPSPWRWRIAVGATVFLFLLDFYLLIMVVPSFQQRFQEAAPDKPLPGLTVLVIRASGFVTNCWFLLLPVSAITVGLVIWGRSKAAVWTLVLSFLLLAGVIALGLTSGSFSSPQSDQASSMPQPAAPPVAPAPASASAISSTENQKVEAPPSTPADPLSSLRLKKYDIQPFQVEFRNYQQINGETVFQIYLPNLAPDNQPGLKKTGDLLGFNSYVIGAFTRDMELGDKSTLDLERPAGTVVARLILHQTVDMPQTLASFVNLLSTEQGKTMEVPVGRTLALLGTQYLVLSAGDDGAKLRDTSTNQEYTVPRLSPDELAAFPKSQDQTLATTPAVLVPTTTPLTVDQLRSQATALEGDIQKLKADGFDPNHPRIQALQSELDGVNQKIKLLTDVAATSSSTPTATPTPAAVPITKDTPLDEVQRRADAGEAEAQYWLGVHYENGWGVSQDYQQALSWYQKAADRSLSDAQDNLGAMYLYGRGVTKDYQRALSLYQEAAAQGNAVAQYQIGEMYLNGNGVTKDYQQALSWIQKAADQKLSAAQLQVGIMYKDGWGVAQDYQQAFSWIQKAADQGNAIGQNNLGMMYYGGQGVTRDYAQAFLWFQKAADQGNAQAQNDLAYLYQSGLGVEKNQATAIEWYRKSAAQGEPSAQQALKKLGVTP